MLNNVCEKIGKIKNTGQTVSPDRFVWEAFRGGSIFAEKLYHFFGGARARMRAADRLLQLLRRYSSVQLNPILNHEMRFLIAFRLSFKRIRKNKIYFFRLTISTFISAGVTPLILPACPMDSGFILLSFSAASSLNPFIRL